MTAKHFYILKIRGVNNRPDFIQIRDEKFTLIAYFRADKVHRKGLSLPEMISEEKIKEIIGNLPYGKIQKIELT